MASCHRLSPQRVRVEHRWQLELEPPGVARVVQFAQTVGPGDIAHTEGESFAHVRTAATLVVVFALPDARPRHDDSQLDGQKDCAGDDHTHHAHA